MAKVRVMSWRFDAADPRWGEQVRRAALAMSRAEPDVIALHGAAVKHIDLLEALLPIYRASARAGPTLLYRTACLTLLDAATMPEGGTRALFRPREGAPFEVVTEPAVSGGAPPDAIRVSADSVEIAPDRWRVAPALELFEHAGIMADLERLG